MPRQIYTTYGVGMHNCIMLLSSSEYYHWPLVEHTTVTSKISYRCIRYPTPTSCLNSSYTSHNTSLYLFQLRTQNLPNMLRPLNPFRIPDNGSIGFQLLSTHIPTMTLPAEAALTISLDPSSTVQANRDAIRHAQVLRSQRTRRLDLFCRSMG